MLSRPSAGPLAMTLALAFESCWPSGVRSMNCRSCSLPNSGAVTDRPHTSARCGWRSGNCGPPRRDTPPPMTANFWPGRASAASARNAYSTSGTRPSLGGVVVSGRSGLTVLYDADCGVCSHTARMLVRADGGDRLRLVSIQSADLPDMPSRGELMDMLHARDEDGRWFKGAAASVEIARRIPIAWPLTLYAKLPMAMPILDYVYRAFADNRQDRKSTRLNSSHGYISYAVFCL